ncbi:MAG: response regulator [Proteobacteria bacterium]|nr:response regulator [Pseudomonadota bacterium]
MTIAPLDPPRGQRPTLLLVDDDDVFRDVLSRAMKKRGYDVEAAPDAATALAAVVDDPPEYAVVDLKLPGASGLLLVEQLHALEPAMRIIVLTGYASIATAVEAVKLGATDYLSKPATADEIVIALQRERGNSSLDVDRNPRTVESIEWEHIQRVLVEQDGNISAAARALKMHRRTLQRKLAKRPSPTPSR